MLILDFKFLTITTSDKKKKITQNNFPTPIRSFHLTFQISENRMFYQSVKVWKWKY